MVFHASFSGRVKGTFLGLKSLFKESFCEAFVQSLSSTTTHEQRKQNQRAHAISHDSILVAYASGPEPQGLALEFRRFLIARAGMQRSSIATKPQ
jgi:hypothetical protein